MKNPGSPWTSAGAESPARLRHGSSVKKARGEDSHSLWRERFFQGIGRIPSQLPVRSTLWNEFGLTVFERAERAAG